MPKFRWSAAVIKDGHLPGRGSGTVQADTPEQAKQAVKDYVGRGGVASQAKNIKLTPADTTE